MFITKEDPRAYIKGSRDPLGIQPIWQRLGRNIITNLTTQSNSIRGFTVLLLGRYFSRRLLDEGKIEEHQVLDVFLRLEQICAYVRHSLLDVGGDVRGIERVKSRTLSSSSKIPIGVSADTQIMSNQKAYGLWGLFSSPARISGLIADEYTGLTQPALEFVERAYWPKLEAVYKRLTSRLVEDGHINCSESNPDKICMAFKSVLDSNFTEAEFAFYGEYLRDASHATSAVDEREAQRSLALLIQEIDLNEGMLARDWIVQLREAARSTNYSPCADGLDRIIRAEAVFSMCSLIFNYLLSRHNESIAGIAEQLKKEWGAEIPNIYVDSNTDIIGKIEQTYPESDISNYFDQCQRELVAGSFSNVIELVIDWNKVIQHRRSGAPWIKVQKGQKLDVRFRSANLLLPNKDELHTLWQNSYFIYSLRDITRQLDQKVA